MQTMAIGRLMPWDKVADRYAQLFIEITEDSSPNVAKAASFQQSPGLFVENAEEFQPDTAV